MGEELIVRQDKELRETFTAEKLQVQANLDELQGAVKGVRGEQGSIRMTPEPTQDMPDALGSAALGSATMQPAVETLDRRLQKEIKDRMQEAQRLWSAIENHTHDLDVSSLRLDTSMLLMEDPPGPPSQVENAQTLETSTQVASATGSAQAAWQSAPGSARGLSPFHSGGM